MVNLADLPNASALSGSETVPMQQGSGAVKVTANQLLSRAAGQALPFEIGGARVLTLTGSSVGIGTPSPASIGGGIRTLEIKSATTAQSGGILLSSQDNGIRLGFYAHTPGGSPLVKLGSMTSHPVELITANAVRSRWDTSGNFVTGTDGAPAMSPSASANSSEGVAIIPGGGIHVARHANGPKMWVQTLGQTGTVPAVQFWYGATSTGSITHTSSSTAYNTTSDYRVKLNLEPLTGALDRIDSIPVYRGNFTADPDAPKVDMFLAHEAQAGVPEAVTGEKDAVEEIGDAVGYREHDPETGVPILASKETLTGITQAEVPEGYVWTKTGERPVYQGIDQSKLVPLHHAGIQELRAEIRSLKARLDALEAAA